MSSYENNVVTVLAPDGEELMPCHPARARKFIREGKAKRIQKSPFIIQLIDEPSSRKVLGGDGE